MPPPADVGFIDLDVITGFTTNSALIGTPQADAELVENPQRSRVAKQAQVPLNLYGRHSWCLIGHQVGSAKPYTERRIRAFHHRSGWQPGIAVALSASMNTGPFGEAIRLTNCSAGQADKSLAPMDCLKVGRAGRIESEKPWKLRERHWKRHVVALMNCHEHGPDLIPSATLGEYLIAMELSNAIMAAR